jgi:hypothetical protein
MLSKDEARELVRKQFISAGVGSEIAEQAIANMPDDVLEAIRQYADIEVQVSKVDADDVLSRVLGALRGKDGHLPGCDGNHDVDFEPRNGIILTDDPDGETHLGAHGLANAASLIKTLITFVAMEQMESFTRWMREREDQGKVSNLDLASGTRQRFSDDLSPRMLAWLALSIRNDHGDCGHGGGGGIPEAFRRPRFKAGNGGVEDGGEPVIDPSLYRIDF